MEQARARATARSERSPTTAEASPPSSNEWDEVPLEARDGSWASLPEQTRGEDSHTHVGSAGRSPGRTARPPRPRAPEDGPTPSTAGPGNEPAETDPADRPPPSEHLPRTVQRHSVRGQILHALRTALIDGELTPGEVYSAPALAERFGVSATPVREAMQRLAAEGTVEVVPNRGFRITVRTPRELAELAEVRALIEVPVMLRLARTIPSAHWVGLRPLAEATVAAAAVGDRARYAEVDRAFHRALLSLAGNDQLVNVAEDLHRRSQWPLTGVTIPRRAELVADAAEHMALLEALATQDLAVVRTLVREHFTGSEG
ncbi:GntR family transcriptional regulator [Streptomyces sp. NPDC059076]|uniref:GntR family transcriptional regulator n=1 Tax=unclassified Streptomyces TaxID=2593676 RepID=UPI0036AE66BB